MDDYPRQVLSDVVRRYGTELGHDSARCVALLRDHCGSHKAEIHALASAVNEHVASELTAHDRSSPIALLIGRLIGRLRQNSALSEEAATWAVHSWAFALGVATKEQLLEWQSAPSQKATTATPKTKTATAAPTTLDPRATHPTAPVNATVVDEAAQQTTTVLPPVSSSAVCPRCRMPCHVHDLHCSRCGFPLHGPHTQVVVHTSLPPNLPQEPPWTVARALSLIGVNILVMGLCLALVIVGTELIAGAIEQATLRENAKQQDRLLVAPLMGALLWGSGGFLGAFLTTLIGSSRLRQFGALSILFWMAALTLLFVAAGCIPALLSQADHGLQSLLHTRDDRLFAGIATVTCGVLALTTYQVGLGIATKSRLFGLPLVSLGLLLLCCNVALNAVLLLDRWPAILQLYGAK